MPKVSKITGPPGTGKTTYLLRQIERATTKYDPDRIGAVSFTKAAVVEMRNRVAATLGMSQASARNIRTVHSHCFRLLGLNKEEIVTEDSKHIKAWNDAYPQWVLPIKSSLDSMEDGEGFEVQDFSAVDNQKRFNRMNIHRGRGLPVSQWYDEEAELFYRDWREWLKSSDLYDFTMILEEALKAGLSPDIDVLFIDESQDMGRLQIQVALQWAKRCQSVIWVGDEDQTLYRWMGANPEDFRALENDWSRILSQSYRVPNAVHSYAMRLISQIQDRDPVTYLPTSEEGDCYPVFVPDLGLPGSHMILTRCQYHLKRWQVFLTREGQVWHNPYRPGVKAWNPASTGLWLAVKTYDQIKSGLEVQGRDIISMMAKLPAEIMERGVKTNRKKIVEAEIGPGHRADVFRLSSLSYFKADFLNFSTPIGVLFPLSGQAGELINLHGPEITRQVPNLVLGTVHSVKGGEANNVWVDQSTSPNIMRSILGDQTSWDDEVRVAYVACTRAKKTLGLLAPFGPAAGIWP